MTLRNVITHDKMLASGERHCHVRPGSSPAYIGKSPERYLLSGHQRREKIPQLPVTKPEPASLRCVSGGASPSAPTAPSAQLHRSVFRLMTQGTRSPAATVYTVTLLLTPSSATPSHCCLHHHLLHHLLHRQTAAYTIICCTITCLHHQTAAYTIICLHHQAPEW